MKGLTTIQEFSERIVLKQLFNTLAPDIWLWVKERKPKTVKEAAELADQLTQARKQIMTGKGRKTRSMTGEREEK